MARSRLISRLSGAKPQGLLKRSQGFTILLQFSQGQSFAVLEDGIIRLPQTILGHPPQELIRVAA